MKRSLAFVALLALTGSGCQMATNPPTITPIVTSTPSAAEKTPLEGTWKMTKFQKDKAAAQDVSKSDWRLYFEGGRLGFKICNTGGGEFTFKDNVLKAEQVMSTLMYCEGQPSDVEGMFLVDLNGSLAGKLEGDSLTLTGSSSTKQVYTFERVKTN